MEVGPGLAAVAILFLSLAAKLMMSFGVNVTAPEGGYQLASPEQQAWYSNISKAQLNVAEYEGLFLALFLFFHLKASPSLMLTIVSIWVPLAQAFYFWGRAAIGKPMPAAPIGALSRFVCMGIMLSILYTTVSSSTTTYGPGFAAVAIFSLSYAAKLYVCFALRVPNQGEVSEDAKAKNASAAQLNVKEYEGVFLAVFLFLHLQNAEGILVTIISYGAPIAQAVYFWGRALSGEIFPWGPLGALPRYACMGIMIYLLYTYTTEGGVKYGPGLAAVAVLTLCLAAKMYMSFAVRVPKKENESKGQNASKAQLNTAEYDDVFMAVFLFLFVSSTANLLVAIVSYWIPLAQAVYFWGRALSGEMMPWAPLGALSRYACMGMMVYLLYVATAA